MSLNVEIKGVNYINKGAELMMHSIKNEVLKEFPNAKLCLNLRSGSPSKIVKNGFYLTPHYFSKKYAAANKLLGLLSAIVPQFIFNIFKVVKLKNIDLVLDASGFTYSDQWGYESLDVMHEYYKQIRKNGTKVVLMPQALGPFEMEKSKHFAKLFFEEADLIYARDKTSLSYAQSVTSNENLKTEPFPDFTNLLSVPEDKKYPQCHDKVCIIPNYRMIDKGQGDVYFDFLENCTVALKEKSIDYFFLIHETDKDSFIVEELQKRTKEEIKSVYTKDPLEIKAIIGKSKFVIGSRFHGLISALSQKVPVILTGWSHKYQELANDYGVNGYLIDNLDEADISSKIQELIKNYTELVALIEAKGNLIKKKSREMWNEVFDLVKEKS